MFPVARRERAAAELTERRLIGIDPYSRAARASPAPGRYRRLRWASRLPSRSFAAAKNSTPGTVGHPGGVSEGDLLAAGLGQPLGDLEHWAGGTSPSYGQPKETEMTPSQRSPSALAPATVLRSPRAIR